MKRIANKGALWTMIQFVLMGLAVALGADGAFAMSEVVISNEAVADAKVPDSKGDETQMPGHSATRGDQVESEFAEEDIDEAIAWFQAYKNPTGLFIHELAKKKEVRDMEVIHYRVAQPVFEIPVLTAKTASGTTANQTISFTVGTDLDAKLARSLYEWKCVYAMGAQGYKLVGTTYQIDGPLGLQVTKRDLSNNLIVMRVLNPKVGEAATIPANAKLLIGAIAASESQMNVAPDNFEPVRKVVYLQKRIFNVVFTREFINGKNKVAFGEKDIRQGALRSYKMNNEITDLLGVASKTKVEVGNNMSPEYVYTTEGVFRQINMLYAYDKNEGLQPTDFTAFSQMMFTKFSESDSVTALCGQDFIASMLNMDFTTHKEIHFEDVKVGGLTLRGWKNNFGTINIAYLPLLDMMGMSKCAALIDWSNAVCYMKRSGKSFRVNMEEGVGDNREAVRDGYSQIYGTALRGYNSLFVCPSDQVPQVSLTLPNLTNNATSAATLPVSPNAGDVVYLTATNGGFPAGSLVTYDGTAWDYYTGRIANV